MSTPEIIAGIDLKLAHVRIELNWNIFDSYREDDDGNLIHTIILIGPSWIMIILI